MLKKLIGAVYLLTTSSLSFATTSTMTGHASLSDVNTNWAPPFADGNTVIVGADSLTLTTDALVTIKAIRLDHNLHITFPFDRSPSYFVGSIAGAGKASLRFSSSSTLTLTGTAGDDDNPQADDYSGLSSMDLSSIPTVNINAPVNISSTFDLPRAAGHYSTMNINNNVVIIDSSIASAGDNRFTIAAGKSLTLSGADMNLTSQFNFSDSGILILSGNNTTYNPNMVSNAANAILNIDNNVKTSMRNVLTINTINIADGKSLTIDVVNSDIDLLNNNASIKFAGSNASIVLTNSGNTDHQFKLFSNLNPSSTTDSYGIVKIEAVTNGLTIANNGGPYTIGQDNTHRLQNFIVEGAGSIVIDNTVFTKLLSMNGTGQATFNQALDLGANGSIVFGAAGKLTIDAGITGNVDFAGNNGVLQLAAGQTITGNVDSSTAVGGTLEFLGKGDITGTIGATKALTALKYSGAGASSIPATAKATTIEVANADAVVTATDLLTANVLFSSNGSLIADKGINGAVTTATTNTGTLTVGSGNVTGAIGTNGAVLKQVLFNGESSVTSVDATKLTVNNANTNVTASGLITAAVNYTAAGKLAADSGITGNVDFAGNNGVLQLAAGQTITGNVDSSTAVGGTLEFLGAGTVTGTIGSTNALTALKYSGAGASSIPAAAKVATIEVANADAVVTATDLLTANVLFSSNGSLIADSGISGAVTTATTNTGTLTVGSGNVTGAIGTNGAVLKQVNLNQGTAASVGQLYATNVSIGGLGPITATDLITAAVSFNNDGSLVADKGISGSVTTATTNTGTLTIGSGDVSGAIGTNGAVLKQVLFNGESSVTSVDATKLTVNNANTNVTASGLITAAVNYTSAGKLAADSGITGNVDFAGNNGVLQLASSQTITGNVDSSTAVGGTLEFLGAGTVTGTIGSTNALTALKYSGAGASSIPAAAKVATIEVANADAVVTATDLLTANVLFSSNGSLISDNGITGDVDFAGNNGVLQLASSQTITGNIDSSTAVGGTLELLGSGTIGGVVTNISIMKAGAGDVAFTASGDYSIEELQGNGSGTITFPSSVTFTGDINTTGGDPINFSFAGNTSITGNIGSSSSPVGNISSNDNMEFNGDINSSGDITTLGTTLFAGDVTCNNIIANKTSSNMLSLSLITLTSAFTASSSNTTNFDQDNVVSSFQGQVNTTGNIEVNGSTYFAGTVNSGGNVVINGDTKFNKTLSSSNNITISNGSNVIFNGDVSGSSINIDNASIKVVDNISMQGNISANNSTIILDNNTLTLSGTSSFSNQLMISSSYDESSLSGGNIILESGSTLDLSNVSELTIKLAFINSDISKINDDTKYNIILAEDGSNIILLSDPENQIVLDSSGEQNKFVKWTLDANSLTLYTSDNSNNVIDNDYVFDSEQDNIFMQELKEALPGSISQEFKNNIGLLSKEQVEEMMSRILDHPKERNSEIIRTALYQTLTDTHNTAMSVIHNRLLGVSPAIVSAGDEDMSKYGVWARSSINHSKDKVSGSKSEYFSSYKTRGHSNTIGFDSLISDNLLIGAAYTNAYTNIRPQDQNIGNVDKVRTNMFSLYSAYNIPNYDWYVDGTISYAESSIRSGKIRHLAVAKNVLGSEVASSKYKSYLYSGSVSLGYNYNLNNNIYVTPSLGAIGSLIRDKGYAESGTSFQNLTVHKKNYNKLSGVAGLRTYRDIYIASVDNIVITPEAYGFINYAIKNKTPTIDSRLPGIDERLPTINYKSNRLDYNLGLGITVKHKMMEYGINYDTNLAKKYQGHSGSLKLRVNL